MSRKEESQAYEAQVQKNKMALAETAAHAAHDLKRVLSVNKFLSFKLHMVFKKRDQYSRVIKRTIYGNEHSVTYDQCLFHKVDCIVLDRKKGYNDLIGYIEKELKGQYLECKIYYDPDGDGSFPVLCRRYFKGGLVLKEDPPLGEEDVRVLYYTVEENKVIIHTEKPASPEEIDFKSVLADVLK